MHWKLKTAKGFKQCQVTVKGVNNPAWTTQYGRRRIKPKYSTSCLNCGDLVAHMVVSNGQVALGDVDAFLAHRGGDQQLHISLLEALQCLHLFILGHTCNETWYSANSSITLL